MLGIANMYIDTWANEPGVDWGSTYDPGVSIGIVTATDTFDLDDSISKISNQPDDYAEITNTDGTISKYQTVEPKRLKVYPNGKYCAKIGRSLVFNKPFVSTDLEFGGAITVPSYLFLDHLVSDSDDVPVDDPNWLILMSAAEWTRTDITLAQNYPTLVAEANDAMAGMKIANRSQLSEIDKTPFLHTTSW